VPAVQVQSPEFKLQSDKKKRKENKREKNTTTNAAEDAGKIESLYIIGGNVN
jgi:hypothetical protein